ncbi:MAG: hypothetical protein U0Q11_06905 [Vicinamibacterales bacterium]
MTWIGRISVLVTLGIICGVPASWSQDGRNDALRRSVERRFDVLPLRDGVALHPKTPMPGVRSVEITGGTIAIDGQPATGAELRSKLGADADAVLQLSYLSDAARRSLFEGVAPVAAAAPAAPAPPAAPEIVAPPPPAPPEGDRTPRTRRGRGDRRPGDSRNEGDRVRFGGDVTVEEGQTVEGDVVSVGGVVTVNGTVEGDVVSVGGGVNLGPHAVVEGKVTAVGGPLRRDPGAVVQGKAEEIDLGGINLSGWTWRSNPVSKWWTSMLGSAFAFVGTLIRTAVLCLFAALVVLLGRDYMDRAGSIASTEAMKAGAIGFASQILFIPLLVITAVVLVMTIIGIPLLLALPFVILALAVAGLVGFAGVSHRVGVFAFTRMGWNTDNPYVVTMAGVVLVMAPVLLSRLASLGGVLMFPFGVALGIFGAIVEYVAWTVGFGAVALSRFRKSRRDVVAGLPSPA